MTGPLPGHAAPTGSPPEVSTNSTGCRMLSISKVRTPFAEADAEALRLMPLYLVGSANLGSRIWGQKMVPKVRDWPSQNGMFAFD